MSLEEILGVIGKLEFFSEKQIEYPDYGGGYKKLQVGLFEETHGVDYDDDMI